MKNILSRFFDRILVICATVAAWMMLAMTLMITYEVCVRYFFNSPTRWVSDFTDYIMLYSTFFVTAWLLKEKGHVQLTILQEHLSSKSNSLVSAINCFISSIVCAFFVYYGAFEVWDAIVHKIELNRPIMVPKWLILWVIPFGFLLLFIQFLRNGFSSLTEFGGGKTKAADMQISEGKRF